MQRKTTSDLKRYTQLPHLLHTLTTGSITVLSPTTWVDRNDAHFIDLYKERKELKSVLVLCLTEAPATYHHWHVFAGNESGICIEFYGKEFKAWASRIPNARLESVRYVKNKEEERSQITPEQLPFIKRLAFRDEREVRLIVEDSKYSLPFKEIPFDISMIKRVMVSPWLPQTLYSSVRKTIHSVCPNAPFTIARTTILENREFMEAGDSAV